MQIFCGTWSLCRTAGEEVVAYTDREMAQEYCSKVAKLDSTQPAQLIAGKGYRGIYKSRTNNDLH